MNNSNDYYKERSERQAGQLKILVYAIIYLVIAIGIFTAGVMSGQDKAVTKYVTEHVENTAEDTPVDSTKIALVNDVWCAADCGADKNPFDTKKYIVVIKAIKNGWIQYSFIGYDGYYHEERLEYFLLHCKLLKRNGKNTR